MSDPTLEALWKNVVDNWDNDSAHAQFLQHCQSTEQLAEAAARYERAPPAGGHEIRLAGGPMRARGPQLYFVRNSALPMMPIWIES